MLTGTGFGDDPPFAHPHRQQPLAERVVDFVGAGMAEIFTLEINLRAAGEFGEPLGEEQGGGPADECRQQPVEFLGKRRIGDGVFIGPLELLECRRERFRNVAAPEAAKAAERVGDAGKRSQRGRRCWRGRGHGLVSGEGAAAGHLRATSLYLGL